MKRFLAMIAFVLCMATSANAMSYEQARQQALFLTDKMAYELNLTDDQYEAAYEINLDYLMSVNTYNDLYGDYWRYRNLDLSYVLLDWQYRAFCDAAYFYRPLSYSGGYWHFGIYARYPHRDYFYFSRPTVYVSYRGGHSWRMNHGRSWYDGRHFGPRPGDRHFGMRDGFNRGDFGRGNLQGFGSRPGSTADKRPAGFGSRPSGVSSRPSDNNGAQRPSGFGTRQSSTRTTVGRPNTSNEQRTSGFGSRRGGSTGSSSTSRSSSPSTTFRPTIERERSLATPFGSSQRSVSTPSSSFGSQRNSSPSRSGGSFGGGSSRGGSSSGASRGGGFGSRR